MVKNILHPDQSDKLHWDRNNLVGFVNQDQTFEIKETLAHGLTK
jgi:hypothetical protein